MTTKITAGTVVTANSRMEVWQPGYMIVRDGRIAEAGPGPGPDGDFEERIDARSSIVMPGLVNGHSHSPSNLLKGTWSRLPLEIWRQYIRAGWREYSDEAIYVSAQLGGWRYGTRTATAPDCMQIVAGLLTEDDVKAVAAFLSSRPAPSDPSFAKRGSLPMPLSCGSEPN